MSGPGVHALHDALTILAGFHDTPEAERERVIADAMRLIRQGTGAFVQTERDLKTSSDSTIVAHRRLLVEERKNEALNAQLHALSEKLADAEKTLQQLDIRDAIAVQQHIERADALSALRVRLNGDPSESFATFNVSLDRPRLAAGA